MKGTKIRRTGACLAVDNERRIEAAERAVLLRATSVLRAARHLADSKLPSMLDAAGRVLTYEDGLVIMRVREAVIMRVREASWGFTNARKRLAQAKRDAKRVTKRAARRGAR